ncbi:putative Autophagy-related protein 22 [Glarea lozoyensis 74030]|uniref:Autophagy-related protein n=1 Tax=Glarea lozoyensis (strain ATCC 74030 / MF5533) TaxID=1104152 RepID=H0ECU6_GLAL7|nr:putative Autophagy-related protein 22 [Glarea lozoyensis 74030]
MKAPALGLINVIATTAGVIGAFSYIPFVKRWGVIGLQQPWEMYPLGFVYGFVLGGLSSYCRALFGELIPPGSEAAFYALYAITDKGSSIFGPAIVGIIVDHRGKEEGTKLAEVLEGRRREERAENMNATADHDTPIHSLLEYTRISHITSKIVVRYVFVHNPQRVQVTLWTSHSNNYLARRPRLSEHQFLKRVENVDPSIFIIHPLPPPSRPQALRFPTYSHSVFNPSLNMAEPIDNTESTSSAHLILSHQIDQPPTISAESLDISEPSEQPEATTPAPLNMSEAMDIELTSSTSLDIANPIDNPQTCSAPSNVSESVDDSEQVTSALPNISELSDNAEGTSPAPLTLVGSTDDTEASPASLDASEAIENPEATSSAPHNASEQTDNPETTASNAPTIPPTDHIAEPDNTILQETLRVIQSIEVPPVQATNPETEDTSTQTTSPGSLSLNATQSEVLSAIEARSSSTTRLSRRRAYGSAPPVPDPKWHYNVARMVALLSVHDDGWEPFEAIVCCEPQISQ